MPRVTVALAVHNGEATLAEALKTAFDQTYRDFEVLVIDDGSADASAEIAESLGARVIQQANTGLGGARKRLVEEANGEWIAFLDHDDFWTPDKLETQLAWLDATGADLAHSECVFEYSDTGESKPRHEQFAGRLAFDHILPSNRIIASSAVFRAEAMRAAGNFIADTVRCSDWYGWLILARNSKFVHLPEIQVRYSVRAESLANAGYEFHRAQKHLLEDHILPRFEELFEGVPPAGQRRYRRMIERNIGVAASSMAKYLSKMGRAKEAQELHRQALRLAGTVPRVVTRALRDRIRS